MTISFNFDFLSRGFPSNIVGFLTPRQTVQRILKIKIYFCFVYRKPLELELEMEFAFPTVKCPKERAMFQLNTSHLALAFTKSIYQVRSRRTSERNDETAGKIHRRHRPTQNFKRTGILLSFKAEVIGSLLVNRCDQVLQSSSLIHGLIKPMN